MKLEWVVNTTQPAPEHQQKMMCYSQLVLASKHTDQLFWNSKKYKFRYTAVYVARCCTHVHDPHSRCHVCLD